MLVLTAILYITVMVTAINLIITKSLVTGIIASILYFLINRAFFGRVFSTEKVLSLG